MATATLGLSQRVAYLVHSGCVEIRNLALGNAPHEQIAELADAIEILPKYFRDDLSAEDWEMVRFVIENYNSHYPDSGWRLMRGLDQDPPRWY